MVTVASTSVTAAVDAGHNHGPQMAQTHHILLNYQAANPLIVKRPACD